MNVLVVDDNEEIRDLLEEILNINHNVIKASSAEEAIKIAGINKPDLIIMDIMMRGGMDGLEATKIIKSDSMLKDVKVFIVSAKSKKEDILKGIECGADDYMTKPFSPIELLDRVEKMFATY